MNKKAISKYKKRIGPGRKSSAGIDFSAIQMKDIARLFRSMFPQFVNGLALAMDPEPITRRKS